MDHLDIIMIIACSIVWLLVTAAFRIFTPITIRKELLALWVLIFLLYLFLVFYIPYKRKLDLDILNAKQEYFDNKDKLAEVYADQLKRKWMDDVVIRNKYYILMFIIWCYIPIPFYMIYLLYPTQRQFTLENYLPIAGAALVLTSMIAIFVWSGYRIGFMQMAYVIACIGCLCIFIAILTRRAMTPLKWVYALIVLTALLVWGIYTVGILPIVYITASLFVIATVIYSIAIS
jgi:hypothetical protein